MTFWVQVKGWLKTKVGAKKNSNFQSWTCVMLCTLILMTSEYCDNGQECGCLNKSNGAFESSPTAENNLLHGHSSLFTQFKEESRWKEYMPVHNLQPTFHSAKSPYFSGQRQDFGLFISFAGASCWIIKKAGFRWSVASDLNKQTFPTKKSSALTEQINQAKMSMSLSFYPLFYQCKGL